MQENRGVIIAVTASKGGPGKTTTAQNLAAEYARQGFKVCIIDADKQGSARKWGDRRNILAESIPDLPRVVVKSQLGDIRQGLIDEAKLYDIVLVDVAGRKSVELTASLIVADLVLIPAMAAQKSLEELPEIAQELIDTEMKAADHRKAFGFINQVDPNASISAVVIDRKLFDHEGFQGAIGTITAHLKYYFSAYDRADRMGASVIDTVQLKTAQQAKAKKQVQVLAVDVSKKITEVLNDMNKAA